MDSTSHDLLITRTLDAPIDKVWQAWTDPAQLQRWWGPRGVTSPTCEWEAKAGSKINIVMLAGQELGKLAGQQWPMTGTMQEVIPSEHKLVFTGSAIMDGKPILENLCTLTLEEQGAQTKLTLQVIITKATPESAGPLAGMEAGWNQSIDKLIEQVS